MQKCGFSETQYAFQYTIEHCIRSSWGFFPFFPDLIAEGRYYGFDVCIGGLFLQFKVCHLKEAVDVKGKETRKLWNVYKQPYYLSSLDFSSNQFKCLKNIAAIPRYKRSVFYAMPEFHTRNNLKKHFISAAVMSNSAHFAIDDFPVGITGKHKLIYTSSSSIGMLFSQPIEINKSKLIDGELFENAAEPISLFKAAKEIASKVNIEPQEAKSNNNFEEYFVKNVYSTLLSDYNIHWIPLIRLL